MYICVSTRYDMVYGDRYTSHKLLERLVAAVAEAQIPRHVGKGVISAVVGGDRDTSADLKGGQEEGSSS
jgi:hypothetical protein